MTARRIALRLAAALALLSVPAAVWGQEPTLYQQGVAARLDGRPADAARLLGQWLENHPGDVDARLQLALADLARGRLDAADAGFRAVLAAAPDYADARAGLAQVEQARRDGAAQTTLSIEGALSDLPARQTGWREIGAALLTPVGAQTTLEARAAWYRRFGREDVELGALLTGRVGEEVWLRGGASVTPGADFRPRVGLTGGMDWRVAGGAAATVLSLDARYEDFPAQQVVTVSPGVVQYLGGGKAWLTLRGFGVFPEGRSLLVGGLARADFAPADRYRLFAGLANGPDTELGVVTRVTSIFAGGEVPLGDRLGLTGSIARETRKGPADRTEFRLGIKARL